MQHLPAWHVRGTCVSVCCHARGAIPNPNSTTFQHKDAADTSGTAHQNKAQRQNHTKKRFPLELTTEGSLDKVEGRAFWFQTPFFLRLDCDMVCGEGKVASILVFSAGRALTRRYNSSPIDPKLLPRSQTLSRPCFRGPSNEDPTDKHFPLLLLLLSPD